jgi:SAM-dependent methyltransferase
MAPYGPQLAQFYDRHWSLYAQNAAPLLREFFQTRSITRHNPSVLDLGCGTGHLALHFLSTGCPVTGLDLSEEMLYWARLHCRRFILSHQASFSRKDIRRFDTPLPFGLVLSTYNTLNHLSFDGLKACFQSSFDALVIGGWALFDLNTAFGFSEWQDEERMAHSSGTLQVIRSFDASASTGRLFIEGTDGNSGFSECIENFAHPIQSCIDLLTGSGFSKIYAARVDDLETPLAHPEAEKRVFLVASK